MDSWWISPKGKIYDTKQDGHAAFIEKNISIFNVEPRERDSCDYEDVMEMGWIRAFGYGNSIALEMDRFTYKTWKCCLKAIPQITQSKSSVVIFEERKGNKRRKTAKIEDFEQANSFQDLATAEDPNE